MTWLKKAEDDYSFELASLAESMQKCIDAHQFDTELGWFGPIKLWMQENASGDPDLGRDCGYFIDARFMHNSSDDSVYPLVADVDAKGVDNVAETILSAYKSAFGDLAPEEWQKDELKAWNAWEKFLTHFPDAVIEQRGEQGELGI